LALFDETPEVQLETLVGEGKKYSTASELAKGYVHADLTIKAREAELQQLREELKTRQTVEEQLQNLRSRTDESRENRQNPPQSEPAKPPTQNDNVDLDNKIREAITQNQRETQVRQNQETVLSELLRIYGTEAKANDVIRQRASELGVSVSFLQDVALQSPKAFFAQLGVDQASNLSQQAPRPTRSEINPAALGISPGVKEGSYEYYENIRKTDPKNFFSPKVQSRLMQDALEGRYIPPGSDAA
jgi:hypothetical protein